MSVKCGKVRDSWIIKASKAFIITVKVSKRKASQWHREIYFTFKSALIFQIFTSFYILAIVLVIIMTDKISKKNIVENSTEVSLKTTTEFDRSPTSGCF